MQIHELNTGTPAATDVLAMDTGSDTYKTTPGNVVPDYTSGDSSTATSWTSVTAVASGLSFSTLIGRITTMMKNVRFLYGLLGTTDISGIGNGTVTGAISALKDKYVTVIYNGDFGVLSAGASGYTTASVVIPSGYITTGIANSVLGHPGVAGGLSINTGVASQLTGTITFYPAYYTPKAISNGNADYKIYILCVKDGL